MGLDMYAYAVPFQKSNKPLKYDGNLSSLVEDWRWKNFYELNEVIAIIYYKKGGSGEFNCDEVELTSEDFDELRERLTENPEYSFTDMEYIFKFFNEAEEKIEQGFQIYYTNWW